MPESNVVKVKDERGEKLLELLSSKVEMPRLTSVGGELLSIMHTPVAQIEMRHVATLVERDPTLTVEVLRTANSVYFGALREIRTVSQAIMRMGFENTIHILSYHCLSGLMPTPKGLDNFSIKAFWMHSWTTATMARLLGNPQYLQHSLPGELYTAGLLHDIGKVVLATYVKDLFEQACALAREKSIPLQEAEMEVMELDHAILGGQVLDGWNLPEQILSAVRGHHSLTDANVRGSEIAKIIELADALAYYCGFEDGTGQPARDPMKTAIIRSGQSPLANPRTLQRVFEDASVTLAQKARIIRKEEKLSNELVKNVNPSAAREYESPRDFPHPQLQPPGFLASLAAWFRKLLSN